MGHHDVSDGKTCAGGRREKYLAQLGRFADYCFVPLTVLPTITLSVAILGFPLLLSLIMSFVAWSIDEPVWEAEFVGLRNYRDLLADPVFVASLFLTLGYTAATVCLEIVVGLAIALLLNLNLPYIRFFRVALIVPMMVTPIVAALCWKLLLDPTYGLVDYLMRSPIIWLGDPMLALITVGGVSVWQNAPFVALLVLAGLQSLPKDVMEAATIDGATRIAQFRHITLPFLSPYLLVALLLRTIFEFRAFDNVYVMTAGGPANATLVLSIYVYQTSFFSFDLTLASAASWVMLLVVLATCLFLIAAMRRREPD
ncbi:carbohydrate ABC transporter permease [Phyllobacterium endophyticum]|uniref:Sugar ABC transporter permease n=1 Tax=Phyllobacterium endophyticum TaxID=1149773 RepID=A0A2P7B0P3_9HYPH|nr:sugar ABC transporter permease [Phyllobacterium endophyticum]MBB3237551.1 multiple sugar transport system permease protein [Phyllobacterium endophyticum]PSH60032.1 sugar ABC transporter permease [Phyllobacterium endophyticum]TYR42197.1 sugar ABC transporter permease [Phyllobacterium endophyticum]